jgi:hypothetical protein
MLQLLSLLLVVELAGVLHMTLDVVVSLGATDHADDHCDDEQGHECPPGCPSCHCAHTALAGSAPGVELGLAIVHSTLVEPGFVPRPSSPPPGAELVRLYRPPRRV